MKTTITWMLVLSNNQKEFQQPSAYRQFNYNGKMYNIHTEKGDLIVSPEPKVYAKTQSNFINSSVLNMATLDCFLNNLSLDQIEHLSFKAKAKKSRSSKNSLKSFSGQPLAKAVASLNCSWNSSTGTNLMYEPNCEKVSSNSLWVSFDLDTNSLEYLFNSLNDCSGEINFNDEFKMINFLVNDSFLKKENKMLVSTTSFTQTSPWDRNSLNLPCLAFLDHSNISLSVSSLFSNNSSNLCTLSSFLKSSSNSSLANSDQLTQENLLNSALTSSDTVIVAVPIYSLPPFFDFLNNSSICLVPKIPSFLRASNCFSSSNLLNNPAFNTSFQLTSGNFFFASSYPGTDNVNVAISMPPLNLVYTPKSMEIFKSFAYQFIPIAEQGDLIVSPEHKVYAQIEKDSLRNWSSSSVVKTLTNDCFFRCELLDQIGALFNSKDKAKKGTSDWSEISGLAFNKNSFDSEIISISANTACLASGYDSNETLLLEQINSRYLSNSLISDSGLNNLRLYFLTSLRVNEALLNKEKTILVSTTSSIYNLPSFFNLFNMSCLSCLPNLKQSSSVSLLFLNNSSSLCKALSLFTSLSNSSLAISDQFTQLKPFMSSINCSSTANVIEAIYLHPASLSNRFNFSILLLRPCLNSSFQLTSGCSSNLFFNSSGIDNVILGIFIPPSNYLITSEIFKSFAHDNLNDNFIHSSNILNTVES